MPEIHTEAAVAGVLARIEQVYASRDLTELRARYDQWAVDYDRHVLGALGYNGAANCAAELARHVPPDARILDVGAGTGLAGAALRDLGFSDIWAIDLSPGMIEQARKKGIYRNLAVANIERGLPFEQEFDAVLSTGVFTTGHVSPGAFERLIGVLKPAGTIYVTLRSDDDTALAYRDALARLKADGRLASLRYQKPFHCFTAITDPRQMQVAIARTPAGTVS